MDDLDQTIKSILAGDINRYRDIVDTYEGTVRAVVGAMVPDPSLAPDLTQEVFIIAFQRLSSYQPGTNFTAWLRTIARNVAQNERRRWYRRHTQEERYRTEATQLVETEVDTLLDDLPEDLLSSLQDCVTRLHGKSKDVMDGFYFKNHSVNALAEKLRISVSSAKVILHRTRSALGSCLQKKGRCHVG